MTTPCISFEVWPFQCRDTATVRIILVDRKGRDLPESLQIPAMLTGGCCDNCRAIWARRNSASRRSSFYRTETIAAVSEQAAHDLPESDSAAFTANGGW